MKAVVRNNRIQAVLMFSSVIFAIFLLVRSIPGGLATVSQNLGGWDNGKIYQTGWNTSLPFGGSLKAMLEEPYTLFAAFIASTLLTMDTHGTDQDMVQRMLNAPNYLKTQISLLLHGRMDLPFADSFLTVGVLISVFLGVFPG